MSQLRTHAFATTRTPRYVIFCLNSEQRAAKLKPIRTSLGLGYFPLLPYFEVRVRRSNFRLVYVCRCFAIVTVSPQAHHFGTPQNLIPPIGSNSPTSLCSSWPNWRQTWPNPEVYESFRGEVWLLFLLLPLPPRFRVAAWGALLLSSSRH